MYWNVIKINIVNNKIQNWSIDNVFKSILTFNVYVYEYNTFR